MFSFVRRPTPPTVEVEVKILKNKKNELKLLIEAKADLTEVHAAIKVHSDMLREDLNSLFVNHVSNKVRKSLKEFNGEIKSVKTYATYAEIKVYFSDTEKKDGWVKYANENEQTNIATFKKDCNTALQEIWQMVLLRCSGRKLFGALRESLIRLQKGTTV